MVYENTYGVPGNWHAIPGLAVQNIAHMIDNDILRRAPFRMKEGSEIHCSVRSLNEHGAGLWSEHSVTVLLKDSCDWKAEKSSAPKKDG